MTGLNRMPLTWRIGKESHSSRPRGILYSHHQLPASRGRERHDRDSRCGASDVTYTQREGRTKHQIDSEHVFPACARRDATRDLTPGYAGTNDARRQNGQI